MGNIIFIAFHPYISYRSAVIFYENNVPNGKISNKLWPPRTIS